MMADKIFDGANMTPWIGADYKAHNNVAGETRMSLSDRYSCQEHGKSKHSDCIACEVYSDIAELEEENKRLREALEMLAEQTTPWINTDRDDRSVAEIMAKYAAQVLEEKPE